MILCFAPFAASFAIPAFELSVLSWLAVDYLFSLVTIFGVWMAASSGLVSATEPWTPFLLGALYGCALLPVSLLLWALVDQLPTGVLDWFRYDDYPRLVDPDLAVIDLTLGLALVAISEELAFRSLLPALLRKVTSRTCLVLMLGAVLFGLAHLRFGLGSIVHATLIGLAFGGVALMTRRLSPVILAHYLINLQALASSCG